MTAQPLITRSFSWQVAASTSILRQIVLYQLPPRSGRDLSGMTLPKDLLPSISRQMPQHSRLAKKNFQIRQNKRFRDRTRGVLKGRQRDCSVFGTVHLKRPTCSEMRHPQKSTDQLQWLMTFLWRSCDVSLLGTTCVPPSRRVIQHLISPGRRLQLAFVVACGILHAIDHQNLNFQLQELCNYRHIVYSFASVEGFGEGDAPSTAAPKGRFARIATNIECSAHVGRREPPHGIHKRHR